MYKRGGVYKIPAAGGLKIYTSTPLPEKCLMARNWGRGGGYIISPWILVAFLLTIRASLVTIGVVYLQLKLFYLQLESASEKHLNDCKQRSSIVSKKTPTVKE